MWDADQEQPGAETCAQMEPQVGQMTWRFRLGSPRRVVPAGTLQRYHVKRRKEGSVIAKCLLCC
jgi:hypothetical protein